MSHKYKTPSNKFFKKLYKLCKPGSHFICLCEGAYHKIAVKIENNGFEIRDCIGILYYNKYIHGIISRKRCKGTIAENVMKYGTGGINIDGCRIGNNAGWKYPKGAGGVPY